MTQERRKICVVTGTRAEYGLLRWIMKGIQDSELLDIQVVVTGMHLSPEFGNTIQEIQQDSFYIDRKVEMLLSSDTSVGVTKSIGIGIISFAEVFEDLQPDLLLLVGDRFEIFAAATAALIARIPIAHCHGGELTEGAFDDAIRHSITKMASIHFVASKAYRDRVIQMGESPNQVYTVGPLVIDSLNELKLLNRDELEKSIEFSLRKRNLLITFHPETLDPMISIQDFKELLCALDELKQIGLIFTMPNADNSGRALGEMIRVFCKNNDNAIMFNSLGQLRYLSCMKHCDAVVGNSSSGIIEAPYLNKISINIGKRQSGRYCPPTVINCPGRKDDILKSILFSLDKSLHVEESSTKEISKLSSNSPASFIISFLEKSERFTSARKVFYDINFSTKD